MKSFKIGDLAIIMGQNSDPFDAAGYWDGCIVKVVSPIVKDFNNKQAHECEIVVPSPAMMDTVSTGRGCWSIDVLEYPKNFSALCPVCKGNSFCTVLEVNKIETIFMCNTSSHRYNTPYASLEHNARTAEEAKWLTPTSKWAWFGLPKNINPLSEDEDWFTAQPPVCSCDVFNFGCSCSRLDWEKNNG